MFGLRTGSKPDFQRVSDAAEKPMFEGPRHAAFSVAKMAKQSIKKQKNPSQPGDAPTTRGRSGRNIRGAIFVDANNESAIAGPRESFVGQSAAAHEFGKQHKGDQFDERPFMGPALAESLDRFPKEFAGSIGE